MHSQALMVTTLLGTRMSCRTRTPIIATLLRNIPTHLLGHLEFPHLWTHTFFNMLHGARKDNETTNNFNQRECKLIRLMFIVVIHDVVYGLVFSFWKLDSIGLCNVQLIFIHHTNKHKWNQEVLTLQCPSGIFWRLGLQGDYELLSIQKIQRTYYITWECDFFFKTFPFWKQHSIFHFGLFGPDWRWIGFQLLGVCFYYIPLSKIDETTNFLLAQIENPIAKKDPKYNHPGRTNANRGEGMDH